MDNRPIGLFDSGVGGLTVARKVRDLMPTESILYFGDTARVPYGMKSKQAVIRFSRQNIRFLLYHKVKAIIVACNTSSAAAFPALQQDFDIPMIGVIEPVAGEAIRKTKTNRIGVIGTLATIESRAYERALFGLNPALEIRSIACPLFAPLVEEGWLDGPITRAIAERYLEPLNRHDADTVILGCTHYPLLKNTLSKVLRKGVTLLDSGSGAAHEMRRLLEEKNMSAGRGDAGEIHIYTSDAPKRVADICRMFFDDPVPSIQQVDIDEFS